MLTSTRAASLLLVALAAACAIGVTPLSKADLDKRSTRSFPAVTVAKAVEASRVALATLGYSVTLTNPSLGLVKTGPRIMYSRDAQRDELAWTLHVEAVGAGVLVRAVPRAFRNGTEMTGENVWVAEIIDPKFNDLWRELGSTISAMP